MEECTTVSGVRARWMALEGWSGRMGQSTMVATRGIRRAARVRLPGPTVGPTKASGRMESSMELLSWSMPLVNLQLANGEMATRSQQLPQSDVVPDWHTFLK